MIDWLGWVALAATCVAAVMTAANLGPRVTGYGFAVFLLGATAWAIVGGLTGQRQLLWSNLFLAFVDLLGIWRWLHRRARAEDAVEATRADGAGDAALFSAADLVGRSVTGHDGRLGQVEGSLADCASGALRYLVIRLDGAAANEEFRRLSWRDVERVSEDEVLTHLTSAGAAELPTS